MTLVEKAREAARAYHAEVHMEDPTGENCGVAVLQAILSDPSILDAETKRMNLIFDAGYDAAVGEKTLVEIEVGAELPFIDFSQSIFNGDNNALMKSKLANWVKKKDGGNRGTE